MNEWAESILSFLLRSSAQLLALGLLTFLTIALGKVRGRSALLILGLVSLTPGFTLLGDWTPSGMKFSVPWLTTSSPPRNAAPFMASEFNFIPAAAIPNYFPSPPTGRSLPPRQVIHPAERTPTPPWITTIHWKSLLASLWMLGAALLTIRLGIGLGMRRRMFEPIVPVTNPRILEIFGQCLEIAGVKQSPSLACSNRCSSPVLSGFFHPLIILPLHLMQPQNEERLRFALLHELAHLRRKDIWWLLMETIVSVFYFFHPMIYWLRRRSAQEREYLCDRCVIRSTGQSASYAAFLLDEVWESRTRREYSFATAIIPKQTWIARRVRDILTERKTTMYSKIRNVLAAAILFALMLSTIFLTTDSKAQIEKATVKSEAGRGVKYDPGDNPNRIFPDIRRRSAPIQISGIVLEAETSKPLSNVNINHVESQRGDTVKFLNDRTGLDGCFQLGFFLEGTYKLVAVKAGYAPAFLTVDIKKTDNAPLEFRLAKAEASVKVRFQYQGKPYQNIGVYFSVIQNGAYYQIPYTDTFTESPTETPNDPPNILRSFILTGIQPGEMLIDSYVSDGTDSLHCHLQPAVVEKGGQTEITLELYKICRYTVTLRPQDNGRIGMFVMSAPGIPQIDAASLCSYRQGNRFSMTLPKGSCLVRLKAPGYKLVEFDPDQIAIKNPNSLVHPSVIDLDLIPDPGNKSLSIEGFSVGKQIQPYPILFDFGSDWEFGSLLSRQGDSGVYFVKSSYQTLQEVKIIYKGEPLKELKTLNKKDWNFDPQTHLLTVTAPVNDKWESIAVTGEKSVPWSWKGKRSIRPGSVKVAIGEKMGVKDEDFSIDENEGIIRFLKKEDCQPDQYYYIQFCYTPDPADEKNQYEMESFGYYPDEIQLRKTMGMPPLTLAFLNMYAQPTQDPRIYEIPIPYTIEEKTLSVFIKSLASSQEAPISLIKDVDYKYYPHTAEICLLKDLSFDPEEQYINISAVPDYHLFRLRRLDPADKVTITVEDKPLSEGKDYTIDYKNKRIELTDLDLIIPGKTQFLPGTKFEIAVGNHTRINYNGIFYTIDDSIPAGSWQSETPIRPGSVKVVFGDRLGVRGEDYEVDEQAGHIWFLKQELCRPEQSYYIEYYRLTDTVLSSDRYHGDVFMHNINNDSVIKLLGHPPYYPKGIGGTLGTPKYPNVYNFPNILKDTISVGIQHGNIYSSKNIDWLMQGEDYEYDTKTNTIHLLKDFNIDLKNTYLIFQGILDSHYLDFPDLKQDEKVYIKVDNKVLQEGIDYTIDHENKRIIFAEPNLIPSSKEYLIHTSGHQILNTSSGIGIYGVYIMGNSPNIIENH
ncbi:MAG: M56 family metallopeptidase [Candidatus Omnitrophota bacterium]